MPQAKSLPNESLLRAALEGLEMQRQKVEEQISQVQAMLENRRGRPRVAQKESVATAQGKKRRTLSAAARKRIGIAQRRRWAEFRKSGGPAKAE